MTLDHAFVPCPLKGSDPRKNHTCLRLSRHWGCHHFYYTSPGGYCEDLVFEDPATGRRITEHKPDGGA